MPKKKEISVEREYIINVKSEIMKVPRYRRTPKAIKAIKQFIARHMRVAERDLDKVKLSKWLNQEMWFRGIQNPPVKIKVKARKEGDNVIVDLVDFPDKLKFAKAREEKKKSESEKKKTVKHEAKEKKPEETAEQKEEEKEKEVAGQESEIKKADLQAREQKHVKGGGHQKEPVVHRMALQK